MNFKRCLFVGTLMVMFLCCYHIMNQHVDELSRYRYTTEDNRKIILKYLNTDEINYLIDRQYQPDEFMRYLGIEGFDIHYVDWYNHTRKIENMTRKEIVEEINLIRNHMDYSTFIELTEHYSIAQLKDFYVEDSSFVHDLSLIVDPTTIQNKIESGKTLFTYVPKDLVEIDDLPIANQIEKKETIRLQSDAAQSLKSMCKASFDINEKVCGNMIITQGYVSFVLQEKIYQDGLIQYGVEEVLNYVDYPGTSIYQLGNVVKLVPVGINADDKDDKVDEENSKNDEKNEDSKDEVKMSIQQEWLMKHAKEYGFVFVNDSSKVLDEFVLQYVGIKEETSTNEGGNE